MKITKGYAVQLSNRSVVMIDHDEIEKVMESITKGSMALVRQGIINPSFIVCITEDKERKSEWVRECNYGDENGALARESGMKPLANIFDGTRIGERLKLSVAPKSNPQA